MFTPPPCGCTTLGTSIRRPEYLETVFRKNPTSPRSWISAVGSKPRQRRRNRTGTVPGEDDGTAAGMVGRTGIREVATGVLDALEDGFQQVRAKAANSLSGPQRRPAVLGRGRRPRAR